MHSVKDLIKNLRAYSEFDDKEVLKANMLATADILEEMLRTLNGCFYLFIAIVGVICGFYLHL